jgi:hypothetical protein
MHCLLKVHDLEHGLCDPVRFKYSKISCSPWRNEAPTYNILKQKDIKTDETMFPPVDKSE